LVQELLQGEELYDRLAFKLKDENYEPFSEPIACKYIKQVLEAINYIHKHNVSHRDIKPENFVFESSVSDQLKLIDFGLCSHFSLPTEKNYRKMMSCVGSPIYQAPEVLKQNYNNKCDIWSAGKSLLNF